MFCNILFLYKIVSNSSYSGAIVRCAAKFKQTTIFCVCGWQDWVNKIDDLYTSARWTKHSNFLTNYYNKKCSLMKLHLIIIVWDQMHSIYKIINILLFFLWSWYFVPYLKTFALTKLCFSNWTTIIDKLCSWNFNN